MTRLCVTMARPCAGIVALSCMLFWGTVPAYADPSFVLAESRAESGDKVHFSISDTADVDSYVIEIADEEVAEGSDPGNDISGEFTMPDLGDVSRAVTVEAKLRQSDETIVRERTLTYVVRSAAVTHPGSTQPAPTLQSAPTSKPAPAARPAPQGEARKRRGSRREAARPRARRRAVHRRERRASERRASERRRSARHGGRSRGRRAGASASASAHRKSRPAATPSSAGTTTAVAGTPGGSRTSGGNDDPTPRSGADSSPPLSWSRSVPALLSPTIGAAGGSSGGPIAPLFVLALLSLIALTLMRAGPGWRRTPVQGATPAPGLEDDGDVEVLRGIIHVPSEPGNHGQ